MAWCVRGVTRSAVWPVSRALPGIERPMGACCVHDASDRPSIRIFIRKPMKLPRPFSDCKSMRLHYVLLLIPLMSLGITGCASTGKEDASDEPDLQVPPPEVSTNRVTLNLPKTTLGYSVRQVGELAGGGLVLVNGVEDRVVGPLEFDRVPIDQVAAQLAAASGCAVEFGPYYHFLYPPGYESLMGISLRGRIPPEMNPQTEGIAFGSGLPLHMLFVWIGYARGITLVPDHLVADTRSGELAIANAPLDASLEGIFKSARLVSFEVESTDEYVFIRAAANPSSGSQLLNPDAIDRSRRRFLEKRVSVMLPHETSDTIEMSKGAVPLGTVLGTLTQQLGVRVEAERTMHNLPVVPAYYHELKVETVLDLFIRQWPVPAFGYHVLADRIVIATRPGQADKIDENTWQSRPISD